MSKLDDLWAAVGKMTPGRWRSGEPGDYGRTPIDIPGRPVSIAETYGEQKAKRNAKGIVALKNAADSWLFEYIRLLEATRNTWDMGPGERYNVGVALTNFQEENDLCPK